VQKINPQKVSKPVGSLIGLKPEYEERYIILHKNAFPGVLDRIRKSNIRNYSIFLLDGILFSHFEYIGNDFVADMKAIADPVTKDWWKLTDPMQEPLPVRKEGEWWAEMDLLLRFGESTKSYLKANRFAYTAEIKRGLEKVVKNIFSNFDERLKALFVKANIHNHIVYCKNSKLYVYFEYTGNDFSNDDKELNSKPMVEKFNSELGKNLKTQWQQMKEVFHTD